MTVASVVEKTLLLRRKLGLSASICKKALDECESDLVRAEELLKRGGVMRKTDRLTDHGLVAVRSSGTHAVMVALRCQTDFSARSALLSRLSGSISEALLYELCSTGSLPSPSQSQVPLCSDELEGSASVEDAMSRGERILGENLVLENCIGIKAGDGKLCVPFVHNVSKYHFSVGDRASLVVSSAFHEGRAVAKSSIAYWPETKEELAKMEYVDEANNTRPVSEFLNRVSRVSLCGSRKTPSFVDIHLP